MFIVTPNSDIMYKLRIYDIDHSIDAVILVCTNFFSSFLILNKSQLKIMRENNMIKIIILSRIKKSIADRLKSIYQIMRVFTDIIT